MFRRRDNNNANNIRNIFVRIFLVINFVSHRFSIIYLFKVLVAFVILFYYNLLRKIFKNCMKFDYLFT